MVGKMADRNSDWKKCKSLNRFFYGKSLEIHEICSMVILWTDQGCFSLFEKVFLFVDVV